MKFTFTEKKVNLPKALHAYAEKKVGKLERYFKTDSEANLVFSVEKDRNKVELTIRSGSTILRVAESTSDMFASVDAAVTSMERQLRKHKTRLLKRGCRKERRTRKQGRLYRFLSFLSVSSSLLYDKHYGNYRQSTERKAQTVHSERAHLIRAEELCNEGKAPYCGGQKQQKH